MGGYENDWFDRSIDDHYVCETSGPQGAFEGMIFMSNRRTKKECFDLKLFGLPSSYARVVKRVRPGMKLFLFEYERRQMYGVFEATTNGSMNIDCNAFKQSGRSYPAQVCFRSFWECYPLSEEDFKDAIIENYRSAKEFEFDLSQDQVFKLLQLFASQKVEPRVHEVRDYFENGQDLPRLDLQSETASLLQEVGRSLFTKERLYKDPPLREDCHVGKTIYGASDAEPMLISRECVHNDLRSRGACLAGQNVCEGDFQASQNMYDASDGEQRSMLHPIRGFTYTCKHDQLNSDFQPFYVRYPNITENVKNAFIPREILINATNQNASGEIYDNNTREFIIASNPQNYYSETDMSCSTSSLDFLPPTLTNTVIEDPQKLRQVSLSISHANNISDSSSLSLDEFQDGLASDIIGLPKFPFLQPSHFSSSMHTLRSNNISTKPSVFSRLKRVEEIGVGHETKHEDLLREISPAKLSFHNNQRNFLSVASNELEVSTNLDDNMQDAEASDEPTVENRLINFKRRSQICKDGKHVEGQTKHSCGEPNSCKPKRRKLIRPQVHSPKTSETSALPLSIVETVQKCSIENKVSPQPENSAHTMNKNTVSADSSAFNFQHISHRNTMDAMENDSLPTLSCMPDYNNSTCPQCVPILSRNVTEHSESGFVQVINENENKNLTDLSSNRALSDCFRKECPSQVLFLSTNKLDVINVQCDSGQENRGLSAYVTKSAESPNVQVVEGVENEDLAKVDVNETLTE